jgi:hypothetical protein
MTIPNEPSPLASQAMPAAKLGRRYGGAVIDGSLSIAGGVAAGFSYVSGFAATEVPDPFDGELWARIALVSLCVSFVNHVVLVLLFRRSVGKFIVGTAVMRSEGAGRLRVRQTGVRWIGGICYGIFVLPIAFVLGGSEAPPEDFAGLRIVQKRTATLA